ncbi:MAG: c-type cytochrome [Pirellula sp.]|jgi:putative heme-binding domain-containing protein|nr:c-type cytochrome [Pirellula sp.]
MRRSFDFFSFCALAVVSLLGVQVHADVGATSPSAFRVPAGFQVDLVYEVPLQEQGSWVCLTIDPKGRILASDQYGKVYRVQPAPVGSDSKQTKVEPIDISIGMAQGLLHTKDGLYVDVNAKEGGGLYRFQDLDGDDKFEKSEHLIPLSGGAEHGPHAIISGPDGRLYLCAGNQTALPAKIDASRVPRHWSEDHMLGRMPDARGFMANVLAPGGFVLSFNPDGSDIEIVSTGFRNEYDIAFNPHGDLFTYDADMEWDVGTPWYRPTRVNHVISGSEFGWRNGTGKWPEYFADSFGSVANIGYGSPTGIAFGTGAKFPAKYQNALLISDWSYGVVYAVSMKPSGASYEATVEPFVSASPMPVTDLVVDPKEGCIYLAIGGRKVQSALYRIRYIGTESISPATYPDSPEASRMRANRRELEKMHRGELNLNSAMLAVGSPDRALRTAARIALEHHDAKLWRDQLSKAQNSQATITLAVALCRKGTSEDQSMVQESLLTLDWSKLNQVEKLELLRAYQLSFLRLGEGKAELRKKIIAHLDSSFPTSNEDGLVDRELARLLIYLEAPGIVDRCVARMKSTGAADEQIHYAFCLRAVKNGWTDSTRKSYFQWFYDVATARGGASFGGFIENIRQVAIKGLTDQEKASLGELVGAPPAAKDPLADLAPRKMVKQWTVDELDAAVNTKKSDFNFERGKQMFAVAQCYKCHRFGGQGGIQGPDLTAASGRFGTRDMLVAIVDPAKEISDQYEATQFRLEDDTVIVGRVANLNGDVLMVSTNMLDPGNFTNIKRGDIAEMRASKVSMMPTGLLDTLSSDEVVDLLAYLKSGGNPKHEIYGGKK